MELMLDTANLAEIEYGITNWPLTGVTSNPSILKKEGDIDVKERLKAIHSLLGEGRTLHVQVVSETREGILREARAITNALGRDICVKIPVSPEGIGAIRQLSGEGFSVTATCVYSAMQGILAVLAGAKYVAVYFNRMENNDADPEAAIRQIRDCIEENGSDAKILAASFKNVSQLTRAFAAGAQAATVPADLLKAALGLPAVGKAVSDFTRDFEALHGVGATMLDVL